MTLRLERPIMPPPPRGHRRWSDVPEEERGPYYEWEGRVSVAERKARAERDEMWRNRTIVALGAVAWMLIGAGIAVAILWGGGR